MPEHIAFHWATCFGDPVRQGRPDPDHRVGTIRGLTSLTKTNAENELFLEAAVL